MKTRFYQIMAVGALCLAAAALALATWTSVLARDQAQEIMAIPTTLNYQGHLREPDGTLTTGAFNITANIYAIATGGSPLYTTTLPGVTVRDGLFNIVLGDNPSLPESVFASAPLYIGISLNGEAELIPRQRLHAVPWAFQASTLINNAVAQTVQGLTSNGSVTVNGNTAMNGDATIGGDLTVAGNIARSGETSVGPHFMAKEQVVGWGACNVDTWQTYTTTNIPAGATAVILEYSAWDDYTASSAIWVAKEPTGVQYRLMYAVAAGGGDSIGWGGQGIYPVKDDGVHRSFSYRFENDLMACSIDVIGYYK